MSEELQEAIYNGTPQHGLAVFPVSLEAVTQAQRQALAVGQAWCKFWWRLNPFTAHLVK